MKQQRFMVTEEHRNLSRIRNGLETVPSILGKKYNLNRMPARGLTWGRFFFGCKIGAINFRKLFTYWKSLGHNAQNPVLTKYFQGIIVGIVKRFLTGLLTRSLHNYLVHVFIVTRINDFVNKFM